MDPTIDNDWFRTAPNEALWSHFVLMGAFEGRPYRCAQPGR